MAAAVLKKVLAVAFVVAVSLAGAGVSAQTHHVIGGDSGWGPDFNVTAWLMGRFFTVGDKIRFEYSGGGDESMVEVRGVEELVSCNVTNPIRMHTEGVNQVALEEEGVRYFTSSNPESCRKGLKLPVPVKRSHEYDPYKPYVPSPPFDPYKPDVPSPPFEPYKPDVPYPPIEPPPVPARPPPSPSSAATRLNGFCFVLSAAALSIYYLLGI